MLNTNIILMCGLPGSGKSTLVKKYEKLGYTILGCDSKTMLNSIDTKTLNDIFLKKDKNTFKVVIDNTNTYATKRKVFINYAKNNGLSIGIHQMLTSKYDCLINSLHRMYKRYGRIYLSTSELPKNTRLASNSWVFFAILSSYRNFNKIQKTEGFDAIEKTIFKRKENWGYNNKALFIGLDGVVRESIGEQLYPIKKEDIIILKNSLEILKKYKNNGYKIIAVTNQPGVSEKQLTSDCVVELIKETNTRLYGIIDDYMYCPHPQKNICYCNKPYPGMGVYMMHKHSLNITNCIMVGDETDKLFGTRLGMIYYNVKEFFNR